MFVLNDVERAACDSAIVARRVRRAVVGMSILLAPDAIGAQKPRPFVSAFQFDVSDTTALREVALDRRLVLRVRREAEARGPAMGWSVAVSRRPTTPESSNLLYHSRTLHGAYPSDLFAWHLRTHWFPDLRTLPVYGYPFEVEIRCDRCTVSGDSSEARFSSGTVRVRWRSLPRANPPPL